MTHPRNPLGEDESTSRVASSLEAVRHATLLVLRDGAVSSHPLPTHGQVVLGRGAQADLVIEHPSVSRRHAALTLQPTLQVEDLGSANGVFVRGRRLAPGERCAVAVGESFALGSVMLLVQASAAPERESSPGAVPASVAAPDARVTIPPRSAATPSLGEHVIVRDPVMRRHIELVARVGASAIGVLLLGETGVGKEVFAEAVHQLSVRRNRPFLRLNCAALSPTLLESELFGYEKGSFTGAQNAKAGLFESADGGTVFLDEVGELSSDLQVKLLRVLEERKVLRIGSLRPRPVDVRFVAATNRDLRAEVARGAFRQDLYFRLNGVTIVIPPLRERPTEIGPLSERFAARARTAAGLASTVAISPAADACLRAYPWPGNVRELRNVIERAVLLAGDGPIGIEHLPPELGETLAAAPTAAAVANAPAALPPLRDAVEAMERERIVDALARCVGNQTRAAEILGMPRRTLVAKIRAYGIPRPRKPNPNE